MFKIFRICGASMVPSLTDGDYVVVALWLRRPRVRHLVVVRHHMFGIIVKRVAEKDIDGYRLESDNSQGVTTSEIGPVSHDQIIGRVLFCIPIQAQ